MELLADGESMLVILQARLGSSRLPGKVMKIVNGRPILLWQLERIRATCGISDVVVATTNREIDDKLCSMLSKENIRTWRGDEEDVLKRYCEVIRVENPDWIIRLTGDCPLFMPAICEEMISVFPRETVDYYSNTLERTFPRGCDIEIVRSTSLLELERFANTREEREHVTFGLYTRPKLFRCENFGSLSNDSAYRWTLDTEDDLKFIRSVYAHFAGREIDFKYSDVMDLIKSGKVDGLFD